MILAEITKLVSRGPTSVEGEGEAWGEKTENSSAARERDGAATEWTNSRTPPSRHCIMRRERLVTYPRRIFCGSLCPLMDDSEVHLILLFHLFFLKRVVFFKTGEKRTRIKSKATSGTDPVPSERQDRP